MMGQSGCFSKSTPDYEQIDTAAEAAAAVDAIVQDAGDDAGADVDAVTMVQLAVCYKSLQRRVRILTWAVALLAIFIVCKEMK